MNRFPVIVAFDVEADTEEAAVEAVRKRLDEQAEVEHMNMGADVLGDYRVLEDGASRHGASLTLERRTQADETPTYVAPTGGVLQMTPPIEENYWAYRVQLSETQAIVGFPKFGTIGIGFAVEGDDWNLNLPYLFPSAEEIFEHIARNKGDAGIADAACIEAIRMVQAAVREDRGDAPMAEDVDA